VLNQLNANFILFSNINNNDHNNSDQSNS